MDMIFGIWELDGSDVDKSDLARMADKLDTQTSKPKRAALHIDGALGMGRLSIWKEPQSVPIDAAAHPICTADARLYQVPGLAQPLALGTADKEALLSRLHATDPQTPKALEGDFAYALWDAQKQQLTLVRDHIGVRPLYYAFLPGKRFVWASAANMIVNAGLIPHVFDKARALLELSAPPMGTDQTLIRDLKTLPPAHIMTVTPAGPIPKRYWRLTAKNPITDETQYEACAAQLRDLMDQAVRKRISPDETTGAHLSGGLDSTSVSVLAARALAETQKVLHSYSFVAEMRPDVQMLDERPYVDATVQSEPNIYNTKIYKPDIDYSTTQIWTDRIGFQQGPEDSAVQSAERDGVDIILSGWGGDEIVTYNGRSTYSEYLFGLRWKKLWAELGHRSNRVKRTRSRILASELRQTVLPEFLVKALNGKQIRRAKLKTLLKKTPKTTEKRPISTNGRATRLALFNHGHIAHRTENWAVFGSSRGIQYAFPFLDRDLLEFAIRLPSDFFFRQGKRRSIFRDAMQGVLPETVRTRVEKLTPFPCEALNMVEDQNELRAELAALRASGEFEDILDFDAIEHALDTLPMLEAVKADLQAEFDTKLVTKEQLVPLYVRDTIRKAQNIVLRSRLATDSEADKAPK